MSRDTFTRVLAIVAIVVACCVPFLPFAAGSNSASGMRNRFGRVLRWLVYCAVEEEFRNQPERQDPGVLLQENFRPARKVGPDGAAELDHGRSW